jgi:DNA transformation protein
MDSRFGAVLILGGEVWHDEGMVDPANKDFLDFVLDQLGGLRGVRHRRMFGAFGLYKGDYFFGIVDNGRLYLLTDETTRGHYEEKGMKAFQPTPDQKLKHYFEVPVDVLEHDGDLKEWVRRAVKVQERKKRGSK